MRRRSHAAAAHSTLQQEFGSPAAYATLVSPRPLVRMRRSMLYRLAMLTLFVWLGWDEFGGGNSWPTRIFAVAAVLFWALLTIAAAVRHLRFTYGDRVRQRLGRRPGLSNH